MVTHIESVTEIIMETSIGPIEPEAPEARIAHEEEENENELRPGKFCHLRFFLFIFFYSQFSFKINSLFEIEIEIVYFCSHHMKLTVLDFRAENA